MEVADNNYSWLLNVMFYVISTFYHIHFIVPKKILCCIVAILFSTDAAARLCARRAL